MSVASAQSDPLDAHLSQLKSPPLTTGAMFCDSTFDLHTEKQFPTSHRLEAWCPTADLLALISHQNDLDLYRLSWQRHWSVPVRVDALTGGGSGSSNRPGATSGGGFGGLAGLHQPQRVGAGGAAGSVKAQAVSLTWRPDGKMIAVGLSNGQVNVYDFRDGSLSFVVAQSEYTHLALQSTSDSNSVSCLKWTDVYLGQPSHTTYFGAQRSPRAILEALPLLSPIPLSSTQQQMMAARLMFNKSPAIGNTGVGSAGDAKSILALAESVDQPDEESGDIMNVLFVATKEGRFMLRLFGGFETSAVSLLGLLDSYGAKNYGALDILKADIQLDLSELVIIALGSKSVSLSSTESRLSQVNISSELLDKHSQEIRVLGLKKRPVDRLLKYISEGLQVMQAEYKKISQLAEDCVESVQQSLSDNGELSTPVYEFVQLLMTGLPSPSLDQYLQKELRRHGLRRWDKSAKAAYASIQRVAFECILPACERLLLHLSDMLGCSRWDERYQPLQLDEALIYNSIKIVGDFVGLLERLFLVLKEELKRFQEFENWLEHVLELLQPMIGGADDQADELPKKVPPVNYASVSQFLQSGLTNKGLQSFFQEPEEDKSEQNASSQRSNDGHSVDDYEDTALGYRSTPSYPIVYSFSEELQSIVQWTEVETEISGRAYATPRASSNTAISSSQKKNPFAGAAMAAALAGRGFAPSLPKASKSPSSLFTTSSAKETPPLGSKTQEPRGRSLLGLTLERHVKLMTRHCQAIFEGPAKAVAKSLKVVQFSELLSSEVQKEGLSGSAVGSSKHLKLATRYCYHDLRPCHHLAIYLAPSETILEPLLCILRTRRTPSPRSLSRARQTQSIRTESEASDTTSNEERSPSPAGKLARRSRKRRASDAEVTTGSSSTMLKTPLESSSMPGTPPALDAPLIEVPNFGPTLSVKHSSSRSRVDAPSTLSHEDGLHGQDFEVALFSLREHGWPRDEHPDPDSGEYGLAIAKIEASTQQDNKARPLYDVRDITFFNDDTLGVLLNSTTTTVTATAGHGHGEQFLLSVPLQSPRRPYCPLWWPSPWPASENSFSSSPPWPCALDQLSSMLANQSLSIYSLPINRSRRVTLFNDPAASSSSTTTLADSITNAVHDHGHGTGCDSLNASSNLKTTSDPIPTTLILDGDELLTGPCRIASNERERQAVVSIHGPSHERASILQGAGRISVFEL